MKSKTITIKVPADLKLAFKMAVIQKDTTMTHILLEFIEKIISDSKKGI